ncbi:hypothetical protein CEXT_213721 [Caerostris extrusa]|uniref:Uncharacterized protein n=1 Tax=Caerostris extrusa TaxID=172846 RepID=A0AAV4XBZ6_CAEEX|nr:hypothetical protein CEXT_213721 [Caerostris extrusa]
MRKGNLLVARMRKCENCRCCGASLYDPVTCFSVEVPPDGNDGPDGVKIFLSITKNGIYRVKFLSRANVVLMWLIPFENGMQLSL